MVEEECNSPLARQETVDVTRHGAHELEGFLPLEPQLIRELHLGEGLAGEHRLRVAVTDEASEHLDDVLLEVPRESRRNRDLDRVTVARAHEDHEVRAAPVVGIFSDPAGRRPEIPEGQHAHAMRVELLLAGSVGLEDDDLTVVVRELCDLLNRNDFRHYAFPFVLLRTLI